MSNSFGMVSSARNIKYVVFVSNTTSQPHKISFLSFPDPDASFRIDLKEEGRKEYGDNFELILRKLRPGFRYTVDIKGNVKNPIQVSAVASCSCDANGIDKTGRPQNFCIRQDRGHVMFEFTDNSYCEEGEYKNNDVGVHS